MDEHDQCGARRNRCVMCVDRGLVGNAAVQWLCLVFAATT